MKKPTTPGRAGGYSRARGGAQETTRGKFVRGAQCETAQLGVTFSEAAAQLAALSRSRQSHEGDRFFDSWVTGNQLARASLDALIQTALTAPAVTHVLIPRRDRRPGPTTQSTPGRLTDEAALDALAEYLWASRRAGTATDGPDL